MKNKIYLTFVILLTFTFCIAQKGKKATFMVMPSTQWLKDKGYMTTVNNQGVEVDIYNYKKAMSQNMDLLPVISIIEGAFKSRELQTINMQASLAAIDAERARDAMFVTKTTKSSFTESPYDQLIKQAKADYLVYVTWNITPNGPNKYVTLTLDAIDAYTSENVASVTGTSAPSYSAILPVMLEEAVLTQIDRLLSRVFAHAEDIYKNGRKINITIKKQDVWQGDFEKEYNNKELREIIEDWFKANTVAGVFDIASSTENYMKFNNVRIPFLDENGKGLDATNFIKPLSKMLKALPYSLVVKTQPIGLGQVILSIGEK